MQDHLMSALRSQRAQIRARWQTLLHVEPVTTPLGNPHALTHLIDWWINAILERFDQAEEGELRQPSTAREVRDACRCGANPLLAFFAAGEQAMREALVLAQAGAPHLDPEERDNSMIELDFVIRDTARREIEAFCGVCQHATSQVALDPVSSRVS